MEASGQLHDKDHFILAEIVPGTHIIGGWMGPGSGQDVLVLVGALKNIRIPCDRHEVDVYGTVKHICNFDKVLFWVVSSFWLSSIKTETLKYEIWQCLHNEKKTYWTLFHLVYVILERNTLVYFRVKK